MKRYRDFHEWVRMLALFTAVFVADIVLHELEKRHLPWVLATVILGLVAILALHIAELITVRIAEKTTWLKRWLSGPEWIEGVWLDEVVGQDHFGLVTIWLDHGEVKVRGEQFDRAGRVTATWESSTTARDGNTLITLYRSPQFFEGSPRETTGFSTYIFHGRPGKSPDFYSGFFIDAAEEGRRCQIRGYRMKDCNEVDRLMSPHERRDAIISAIARIPRASTTELKS